MHMGQAEQTHDYCRRAAKVTTSKYLSNLYMASTFDNAANTECEKFIKAAGACVPNDPLWHGRLARYYDNLKQPEHALDEHLLAMQGPRVCSSCFENAAEFLNRQNRMQDALACMNYFEKLRPWSGRPRIGRASIYVAHKEWDKAELELKNGLALNPYNLSANHHLFECYQSQSKLKEERQTLLDDVKYSPQDIRAWRWLGDMDLKIGNRESASKYYQHLFALTNSGAYNILLKDDIAIAHANVGSMAYEKQDFSKAADEAALFNRLKFIPKSPPYLSWVHIRPDHLEPGKTKLEREVINHVLLADMLRESGHLDQCISEYRLALKLSPADTDLHSYLLDALTEKGDWLGAAQEDFAISNAMVSRIPAEVKKMVGKKPNS